MHERVRASDLSQPLLVELACGLKAEFCKGFDERDLRHMRAFYQAFPIWNALRSELSWTHYRSLLKVDSARQWCMNNAVRQSVVVG